jgi:hypothetical protein
MGPWKSFLAGKGLQPPVAAATFGGVAGYGGQGSVKRYKPTPQIAQIPRMAGTREIVASAGSSSFTAVVKPIRFSKHALDYANQRGFTPAEVDEAIRTSSWNPAELGRLDCRKDFSYGKEWNGRLYATKQVRPVFVEEAGEIVVITVYTYYS